MSGEHPHDHAHEHHADHGAAHQPGGHGHSHGAAKGHGGHGHDHGTRSLGDAPLVWAMALNLAITLAQIVGGILSGSLALLADALHNFSDGAAFGIALIARRISRRPADEARTFGYRRVEVIGATINLTALILIGLYLLIEAGLRFMAPVEVHGWSVIVISAITVLVDVVIAIITYAMSKESLNIRAAFVHNAADAAGAFGVLISGVLILLFQWHWVDLLATVVIAGYILYQGIVMLRQSIRTLMLSTPVGVDLAGLASSLCAVDGVEEIHHLHVWELDEQARTLEAHVVIRPERAGGLETIKAAIKTVLKTQHGIAHSTLEFEIAGDAAGTCGHNAGLVAKH